MKMQILCPHVWGSVLDYAFLMSSQAMLMHWSLCTMDLEMIQFTQCMFLDDRILNLCLFDTLHVVVCVCVCLIYPLLTYIIK